MKVCSKIKYGRKDSWSSVGLGIGSGNERKHREWEGAEKYKQYDGMGMEDVHDGMGMRMVYL